MLCKLMKKLQMLGAENAASEPYRAYGEDDAELATTQMKFFHEFTTFGRL